MRFVSNILEIGGALAVIAGVYLLADAGWAMVTAGVTSVLFGIASGGPRGRS